ncbi:AT-rich interactive domain-containing protein 2-like isoform X2 [Carcharodon carcharias]|uniref:AT-rich interactive domain-containing protein 2-like isoform X2 n=1 Tax=Carcharodon carcharias TaxID=13397 RepID=UPI001B7E1C9A|nr:AT-rich interactive domain-containing protein 2-like isoform X2 [Carcharodon carcharias]
MAKTPSKSGGLRTGRSFLDELRHFHRSKGTSFRKIPIIGGRELDLSALYSRVTSLGGFAKVTDKGLWADLLEEFNFPRGCANAAFALKQYYLRYLESYEKLHHFGEDDEVLTPTNSRPQGVVSGVHLFYNRHQHIIPESVRRGYGLFTEFTTISDYNKVVLSLLSGLPNEVDFAINVCTLMSHGNKQVLQMEKDPKVVTLLLAHAGIFDDSPGTYLNVYESEWKVKSGRDFIKFWKETVEDHEVRELIGDKSQKSKEAASDDRWDSVLFHPPQKLGINDLEGQRVLQIAVIIHNLSMEEGNAKLLANRTCLRFLLLCAHNSHVSLKQMGLDTLGNVMAELDPIDFQSTQVIFHTITKCLYSTDKWFRIRGMEILANLCKIEENVDIICECVEQESYREIVNHLSLQDILLLLASLEALYMLSSLGEVTCTKIIKVERSIDQLVCLVSVDMQNFPPDALAAVKLVEQQSTLQQPTPETSRSVTTENVSNQSTPVTAMRPLGVPSASLLEADSETFTCQWLNANFEESADSSIYRVDLYSEYLSLCSKLGSSGILTSTGFTKCLRLTFPNHTIKKIEDAGANGQSQFHVVGIKRRTVPLPVGTFHQEQQTPNHSFATIKASSASSTTVNPIAVGMTVPSPAVQMHRTLTPTSQSVTQILYTTQTQSVAQLPPGISTPIQQHQYCTIASKVPTPIGGIQPNTIQASAVHPNFHSAVTTVVPGNAVMQMAATKVTTAVHLPTVTTSVHLPHVAVTHQSLAGQQSICSTTTVPVLHQTLPNAQFASRMHPITSAAIVSQGQLIQPSTAQPVQVHLQYTAAPTTVVSPAAVQLPSNQTFTIAGSHNSVSSQTFQNISPTPLTIVSNSTQFQQQQGQQSVQVIVGHQGQVYPASFHQIVLTNQGGISSAQLPPPSLVNPSTCGQVLSVQQPPIQVHVQQPSIGGTQSSTGETSVIKQLLLPKPPPHSQAGKLLLPIPQVSSSVTRAQSPQVVYQMMANTAPSVGVQPQSQQLVVSQSNLQILQPHGSLQTVQIIPGQFISTTSPSTILQGPPLNQQVTVTVIPNTNLTNTHVTQVNTKPANSLPGDHSAKPVISTHVIQSSHAPFNQSNIKVDEFEGEKNVCQNAEDDTKMLSSQSQEQTVGLIENSFLGNAYNASNGHLNGRVDQTGMLLNGESKKENPSSGMNHCGFVESTSAFQESKASSGENLTNGDPILEKPGAAEMKNVLRRPLINGDSDFAKGDRSHIGKDIPNEKSVASNHLGNGEILNQEHQGAKCRLDGENSQPGKMCNGPSSISNVKTHAHTTVIVPNPTVQQAHRNSVLTSGTAAVTFNVTLPQPHHNGNVVVQSNPTESSQVTTCQSSNTLSALKLSTCEGQPYRQAIKRPGEDTTGISMAGIPNKVGVRIMTVSDPTKAGSNTMMVAVPAGATINTATIAGVPKVSSPAPVSSQQTVTQHPQSQVSPAVEHCTGSHSSQVPVSAPETESAKKPSQSFMCLWKDCKRWFETPSQVFYHAATEHGGKDVYQGQCMWEGCEPLPRQRLSFITHLQDKHCSREALLIGLKRLEQKAQTSTSQTAVRHSQSDGTAPTPKSHKALVNHPSAALMALRKGSRNLIFRNYLDEKEGPIVKHIRLTSALILKNVARYSELGRVLLKRHENHLSVLAISGMEASTALAKCLFELNSQEQSESTESKR